MDVFVVVDGGFVETTLFEAGAATDVDYQVFGGDEGSCEGGVGSEVGDRDVLVNNGDGVVGSVDGGDFDIGIGRLITDGEGGIERVEVRMVFGFVSYGGVLFEMEGVGCWVDELD